MSNKKSTPKVKEPIKIRFKRLKNGNKSVYLAHWNNSLQKWEYEFLKDLYIVPDNNNPGLKSANDTTLQLAKAIQATRIVELQNNTHGFSNSGTRSKVNVIDYIKTLAENKRAKSGKKRSTHQGYLSLARQINEYSGPKTTFKQVDKVYCQGFLNFLKTTTNLNKGQGNKPLNENTRFWYMTVFEAVLNAAISDEILSTTEKLKGGKANPFFDNRMDGYLFIISPDRNTIEILIVPQGRQLIRGYAAKLADGQLNEALNELRESAKREQH